ncbi:MAG: AAA family ATPase [Phycisphaerales bacterium]|nr:AAA family ATPase [Phycisphaerales bacterium]
MNYVKSVKVDGFKSFRSTAVELGKVNVLIGANGAGKSNFLAVFHMISFMMAEELQTFVGSRGRASSLLHYGPKRTPRMSIELRFQTDTGESTYACSLAHAAPDSLIFVNEEAIFNRAGGTSPRQVQMGAGHWESAIFDRAKTEKVARVIQHLLQSCKVFQFHDTSPTSPLRSARYVDDNRYLRTDGGNLAAFLLRLRETRKEYYDRIVATVRQIAPFFRDFVLDTTKENRREIFLNWRDMDPEGVFGPHLLSDGTLRAMALITLLLQPEDVMPKVILIDEPELGLHPYAIEVLASLMKTAAEHAQIIAATQSTKLVDQFETGDIVVADRSGSETRLSRPDPSALREWIEEYSVGDLWEKNVLGGRPSA